jgi:hypothetical protein
MKTEESASPLIKNDRREVFGWIVYDWANSGFYTTVVAALFGDYLTRLAQAAVGENGVIFAFGPILVTAKSLAPFTVGLSVFLQVFLLPILGALGDYSTLKKRLMIFFCYAGVGATCLLFFLAGGHYIFGSIVFIVANVCFGAQYGLLQFVSPGNHHGRSARPGLKPWLRVGLSRWRPSAGAEPCVCFHGQPFRHLHGNGCPPFLTVRRNLVGRFFDHYVPAIETPTRVARVTARPELFHDRIYRTQIDLFGIATAAPDAQVFDRIPVLQRWDPDGSPRCQVCSLDRNCSPPEDSRRRPVFSSAFSSWSNSWRSLARWGSSASRIFWARNAPSWFL